VVETRVRGDVRRRAVRRCMPPDLRDAVIVEIGMPDAQLGTPLRLRLRLCCLPQPTLAVDNTQTPEQRMIAQLTAALELATVHCRSAHVRMADALRCAMLTPGVVDRTRSHIDGSGASASLWLESNRLEKLLHGAGGDMCDPRACTTNDVHVVRRVLGVEAAREVLRREMVAVVNTASTHVDPRHIGLLCDYMMVTGVYRSLNHRDVGLARNEVLAHASYERQGHTIMSAARNARATELLTPSAAICLGGAAWRRPAPRR